jgi:hypothetical protein
MKYQVILNGNTLFETDNVAEYFSYLLKNEQIKNSVLYNLLEKSNGHISNMVTE